MIPFPTAARRWGRHILDRSFAWHCRVLRWRGVSSFNDIQLTLPGFSPKVIFDVGANFGFTSLDYISNFPSATIYAFEPSHINFAELRRRVDHDKRIRTFQLGASSTDKVATFADDPEHPTMARLAKEGYDIHVTKIDTFCNEHGIHHIDYLKIDTEGHDLDVIKGASGLLIQKRISFLEVECGMHSRNKYHVPFELIKKELDLYDYHVFGIYEQKEEFKLKRPYLRRVNAVFMPHQDAP